MLLDSLMIVFGKTRKIELKFIFDPREFESYKDLAIDIEERNEKDPEEFKTRRVRPSSRDSRGAYYSKDSWKNKNGQEIVSDSSDEYSDFKATKVSKLQKNKNNAVKKNFTAIIVHKDDSSQEAAIKALDTKDAEKKFKEIYGSGVFVRDIREV